MIKVAHVTTIAMSLRYLLLDQLRRLRQMGYNVVGISTPGPEIVALQDAQIQHIPVRMTRMISPLRDLLSLWQLYRVLRRERFTIVHAHTPKAGLLAPLAARLAGVPVVAKTTHGFYFHERTPAAWRAFYIAVERIGAACADVVFLVNREDVQTAVEEHICRPGQIRHLGAGIDTQRFDRTTLSTQLIEQTRLDLGLEPGAPVVGFIGRLVAEKGIIELLRAFQVVLRQEPRARLLIIGPLDPEKTDALTPEIASEYGVAHACIFTGMRQDMPELLALMNVFVLPSHREGLPLSLMEASAMGVPCIATDIRGCREVVFHERNGLLTPPRDVKALADAILRVLGDPQAASQMGQAGRQLALEQFDERLVFEKVQAEYARLLRAKGMTIPLKPATGLHG